MKTQVYLGLAIRIIVLFTVGAFMTFIPDYLRDFFGDTQFQPYNNGYYTVKKVGQIDNQWYWGARHYWYFWMMVLLFILSLINVIVGSVKLINKHYEL